MHIITYKNGMSKNGNLRVKQRLGQNILLYNCRTLICFLAIVNVTYVTQCHDIKSSIVVKSWKTMWHTDKMVLYIFWSWLFVFPDKTNFWSTQLFGIHDAVWSVDMVTTYWNDDSWFFVKLIRLLSSQIVFFSIFPINIIVNIILAK